jgi:hypothetical protein
LRQCACGLKKTWAKAVVDQRVWEIALAFAVRDALRAGDLYLPESRHHVSFSNLIYGDRHWQQERSDAYRELNMPFQADQVLPQLRAEFDEVAKALLKGFPNNPFAKIQDGTLKLKCRDTLPIRAWIKKLRRLIQNPPAAGAHREPVGGGR